MRHIKREDNTVSDELATASVQGHGKGPTGELFEFTYPPTTRVAQEYFKAFPFTRLVELKRFGEDSWQRIGNGSSVLLF